MGSQLIQVKNIIANVNVQKRFNDILGKKAQGFMASIINLSNGKLKDVEPYSIVSGALIAATLDLPIDPNLGFAWIVPYKRNGIKKAQFQMGYKGFVQLALRTGQYKNINVIPVYEGELINWNPLSEEIKLDFSKKSSDKIIGYAAYFKLINGFEKTVYWSKEKVTKHGRRYSKSFSSGPWQSEFDSMAEKTVLKNTLSKWGILSIDMQTAMKADQAIVKKSALEDRPIEDTDLEYIDNPIDAEFEDTPEPEKVTTKIDEKLKKESDPNAAK